jgi:hypothetical protein
MASVLSIQFSFLTIYLLFYNHRFVRAMEYFENIVIAVATLLEPMIATMIAFCLGVGELPGAMGWIGNFLVAIGTLGVVYPSIHDKSGGVGH